MIPELVSLAWLNLILVAFLLGFGFRLGTRFADGLLNWVIGLFRG